MILRPYQQDFVSKMVGALQGKGNSLGVAPTGSGKTIMLSDVLDKIGGRQLVLQHREELVNQNRAKFQTMNPKRRTSIYGMGNRDDSGETIFGMIQTIQRKPEALPKLDILMIDEAHHARADTYHRLVEHVLDKNPDCYIAGVTATPARGDGKGLRPIFDNVCHQISMKELIDLGFLVPPRTFIASLPGLADGLKKLAKSKNADWQADDLETLMNTRANNKAVVREWRNVAGDRKTIVFCSTIRHAQDVCREFQEAGVKADCVFGDTPNRAAILADLEHGDLQVCCNVSVLTEGIDIPPVSCVVLLRPSSFKSTVLQMAGRALRTIDPELYPGIIKTDAAILDFGESLKLHGGFEMAAALDDAHKGESPTKQCPTCAGEIPQACRECPICGHVFPIRDGDGKEEAEEADVVLTEVDIMKMSPFRWVDLFGSGKVMLASGFKGWVTTCSMDGEKWFSLGKLKGSDMRTLAIGHKTQAMAAADDFLRMHEDSDAARKSKRWMKEPASVKQLQMLEQAGWNAKQDFGLQKYNAACLLNFLWAKNHIERKMYHAS